MTLQTGYLLWSFANSAILLFIAVYTWVSNRDKVGRDSVSAVRDCVSDVDQRVGRLEEAMRHIPQKEELAVLHKRITEVSESQRTMQGELRHINRTLGLIHEYLLHHRGREP
ncbi:MAG: DUF2730 family protein [Pseudomonadota bacterium]